MIEQKTFAQKVIEFNKKLSKISMELPDGFKIINPFNGSQKEIVNEISTAFYKKFYNDCNKRRIILGSSPARRGTAVTGVPFEDAAHLQKETGILIDKFYINKSSSGFLYDVIEKYGGTTIDGEYKTNIVALKLTNQQYEQMKDESVVEIIEKAK